MAAKLDVIMSVMSQLKYDAVGLGNADVHFSEFLDKAKANKLTVVDASPFTEKGTVPYIIKDVGGVKVGVISFGVVPPDVKVSDFEIRKLRFAKYKEVREKCDVLVLLDQSNTATDDWIERNSERLGAPDIVIGGVPRAALASEQVLGKTHVMPSLTQGKDMGVIDVEVTSGQPPRITFNRVNLNEKFVEDPEVTKRVGEVVLKMAGASAMSPSFQPPPGAVDASGAKSTVKPYYSPMLCKACHEKQYDDWTHTKHAVAIKTLVDKNSTTADCLPCHSEVYRAAGRYVPTSNASAGVECATCHMNALPHGLERKSMTTHAKVDPNVCLECHTKDRSPTYDVKTYFPKVVHATTPPSTTASTK